MKILPTLKGWENFILKDYKGDLVNYNEFMKITVQVKPNSKKESLEQLPDGSFLVRFNVPPIEGRANERLIEMLSDHFKKSKSHFEILSGLKSKKKIVGIKD